MPELDNALDAFVKTAAESGSADYGNRILKQPASGDWCAGIFVGYGEDVFVTEKGERRVTTTCNLVNVRTHDGPCNPDEVRSLHLDYKVLRLELHDPNLPADQRTPAPRSTPPEVGSLIYVLCRGNGEAKAGRRAPRLFRVQVGDPTPDSRAAAEKAAASPGTPNPGPASPMASGDDDIPFQRSVI